VDSSQRISINSAQGELKEEEIVHYLVKYMEIVKQVSVPLNTGLEEVDNHHALC
jgi:hypothetical protein